VDAFSFADARRLARARINIGLPVCKPQTTESPKKLENVMAKKVAPKAKNLLVKTAKTIKSVKAKPVKKVASNDFVANVLNSKIVEAALKKPLIKKGSAIVLNATANVREKGEEFIGAALNEVKGLRKKAEKLAGNVLGDVQEQANGVLAQVKSATAANLDWVADKAQDQVGKVLSRLGVPSKSDITELSRRVNELSRQVKSMKKAA
jgi:poly(hydroxyalkanoate) granule-associated protein